MGNLRRQAQSHEDVLDILAADAQLRFVTGQSCREAVFGALSAQFGLSGPELSLSLGSACGAFAAGVLALSLAAKEEAQALVQRFGEDFEAMHGSCQCAEILEGVLGRSYRFPEEEQAYRDDHGRAACLGVVRRTVRLAGELILSWMAEEERPRCTA